MRFLVIALILGFNNCFSQSLMTRKTNLILNSSITKQRMDYFWNFGVKTRVNYFEVGAEVGIGVEKTFFQQSFSPHLELTTFYNIIQQEVNRKNGIVFGPGIILSGTTYKIQTPFRYGDILLAYQFCLGRKWKFFHQGGYGIMFESFRSNDGKIVSKAYNYCFKIGICYAMQV
jgi:hypothetical protein